MNRLRTATLALVVATAAARAHFVLIVPDAKVPGKVAVVFSDTLGPDESVEIAKIAGLKLTCRDVTDAATAVEHKTESHALTAMLPGKGPRLVSGRVEYGVMQRGDDKPFLLVYHPKALVGGSSATLGESAPVELVPAGEPGQPRLRFLAAGKPVADVEVTIMKTDGPSEKVKTDKDGRTPVLSIVGRYGAWAKHSEAKSGELGGKKYAEVRHYATLVADAPAASKYPPLPEAVSSLGAIVSDGYLYVHGGHAGRTHTYSTETASGKFHRLKLAGGTAWEELPGGPGLQGMNLAAHGGKIYRVGGMQPRNKPGEKSDNHSVADCARFDPATRTWEAMPPLPEGRSSHELVTCGDLLVVVGGWVMKGSAEPVWPQTALVMDLAAAKPEWKAVPQPFQRRALTAAAVSGKVYVCGGLTDAEMTATTRRVDVFDPKTGAWSKGPDFPGAEGTGFSPAACEQNGKLVLSTSDGLVHRMNGATWELVGTVSLPRRVHRLVADGPTLLAIGGASREGNVRAVEAVVPQ
ncbi:MAG: hypothetical protein U0746_02750 [Gemmataceae bacterium]